ncbi:MAG: T9SS type A sorting domain-containing protein, partial [Bacteroidales bacterium]
VSFSVSATSASTIAHQWEVSTNNGSTWTVLSNDVVYTGVTTATLHVIPSLSLSGNLYHDILTNANGATTSDAASLTVANCDISGTLNYGNTALDALADFIVTIDGKSATTDASGDFTITGVTSGNHPVTVDPQGKAVGGINSTDAGLANYWGSNPTPIPFVRFMSGDVNNDLFITSADALRIQNYFVTGQQFDRDPWQFHNATGTGTTNPPVFTAPVNGSSVSNFDILSLSTGDFNASFNPNDAAKGAPVSGVRMLNEGTVRMAAGRTFDLPLRAVTEMEVGAVSLILNLSSDLVEVVGVEMLGSKDPVSFKSIDNQVRIGWHSLTPLSVKAGGDMVILKLRSSVDFTDGKIFQINVESDPLNEIATGKFSTIEGATLKSETVAGSTAPVRERTGNELGINIYPNPVNGLATLNYTIPGDGEVTVEVYNSIGAIINTLINEPKTTGKHTLNVDFSTLPRGMYMAKIKLHGNGPDQIRTVRFIVNK